MSRSEEYSELFYSYALKNRLDENIDDWPQKNIDEWEKIYQDFLSRYKYTEPVDASEANTPRQSVDERS